MKCKSCGEELPERARFCFACGAPVEDVPAPKRLEEPLDPLAAGAVPLVPLAPPPRAYRMEPRATRAVSRGERRPAHSAFARPAENDEPAAAPDHAQSQGPEKSVDPAVPASADATAHIAPVSGSAAEEVDGASETPTGKPAADDIRDAARSKAAAAGRELSEVGANLSGYVRDLRAPRPVLVALAAVAVLAVALLVWFAVSPLGPFALPDESAPVVQPPSDGSIPPLEAEDEEPEEEPAAESGELTVRARVEEYSWDELAQISALIAEAPTDDAALEIAAEYHLCLPDGTLDGSQTKELELSDGTTVTVAVAGFRHDQRADGSGAAGVTFVTLGSLGRQAFNPSGETVAWEDAPLRSWMNQSLMAELPEGLADLIVPVDKLTNDANGTQRETQDSLWLISRGELTGQTSNGDPEGEQYQLFSDRGVDGESSFLAVCDDYWWLRGVSSDPSWQGAVTPDGSPSAGRNTIYEFDVVAGFCL